jgi:hypothetical protein
MMLEYYQVLNNAWKREIKEAARAAIGMLTEMPKAERMDKRKVDLLLEVINQNLGDDFMMEVSSETKAFVERSLRLGIQDVKTQAKVRISVGLWGIEEQALVAQVQKQNLFWIGQHFEADISQDFRDTLTRHLSRAIRKEMLADALKESFSDLGDKVLITGGIGENIRTRIREFGRLSGYKKAGAKAIGW